MRKPIAAPKAKDSVKEAQDTGKGRAKTRPAERIGRKRQLYLAAGILLLALWIAMPFLTAIAWASILAIAQWPLYKRMLRRWPTRPTPIAAGFGIATGLAVIVPLSLAAASLASEAQNAAAWLQHAQQHGVQAPAWLAGLPVVGDPLSTWWKAHLANASGTRAAVGWLASGSALAWVRGAAGELAKDLGLFLITLLLLTTILARGKRLAGEAHRLADKLFGSFGVEFLQRMAGAVRATVNGTLLVSFGEGALIGVGYLIAGVPQPVLFTLLTITLALVPFGAWAAFGLASLILVGSGATLAGLLLLAGASVVMLIGDNVVQPAAIGSAVKLPFILALLGAFGGLAAVGLVGLFIGPVVMAALQLITLELSEVDDARKA